MIADFPLGYSIIDIARCCINGEAGEDIIGHMACVVIH